MRKILEIVVIFLLFSCTIVERDNPYDSGGKNYMGDKLPSSSSVVSCSNVGSYSCDMSGYRTVEIGSQTWMAENLNCDVKGSYCYDKKTENCTRYGRLYDWCTAMAICTNGWHLPSDAEWQELLDFVVLNSEDSLYVAGGTSYYCAGKYLKADSGWDDDKYGKSGNGEDTYKFSALPGGQGYSTDHYGFAVGDQGYWWTATEHSAVYGSYQAISMSSSHGGAILDFYEKDYTFSVRCVRD